MTRAACYILAALAAASFCDGCRRIKAPYPPKEPPIANLAVIDAPPPTTRPARQPTHITVYKTYVVQRGDTLGRIAQKVYKNPHNDNVILDANPGLDPRKLTVGQEIKYPVRQRIATQPANSPASGPS